MVKEKKQTDPAVRITVYLNKNDYKEMRANLVLQGKTISQWVREKMASFLKSKNNKLSP